MNRTSHSLLSKQTQLLKFSKRLKNKVETGEFSQLPGRKRHVLTRRIVRLHRQLSDRMPDFRMSHAFAISTLALGLAGGTVVAQQPAFAPAVTFPYGINTYSGDGYLNDIDFADLDGDGDLDAVILDTTAGYYVNNFRYLENTGTATAPVFTDPATNPFAPETFETFAFLDLVDLDSDGDTDLLYVSYDYVNYSPFLGYRENTGTATNPVFGPTQMNPFGFVADSAIVSPVTVDFDNDGDKDLLINDYDGQFLYFENTGTATVPAFGTGVVNPYGLTSVTYLGFSDVADLDGDGDMDVLTGEYYGVHQYFENTGTASAPAFAAPVQNPFGLTSGYYYSLPAFADLDGDGDMDLTVSQYGSYGTNPVFIYFENTTPVGVADPLLVTHEFNWQLYPNPAASRSGRTSFTVQVPPVQGLQSIDFELINGIGQIMQEASWQMESTGLTKEITVKGLPPGMYFVRLDTGDIPMIKKLVLR